ncbi:MAG: hypothetical protein U0M19_04975 [Caecibacter sp.]|nr:hypothetical protein [Megasphaera sp.]MEE0721958.1 hypothetical protein [Caecibacter sp.]
MKSFIKIGATLVLAVSFLMLSGFRAQTIIHDDGSETQDVLKVSQSLDEQKKLRADADEFQKRNFTIMDYSNSNGEGFRAMRTITKEGANKSSVDRIVHKTHDGLFCSTYYIDYDYTANSVSDLRLGMSIEENGADLEYIISFPSGADVKSNATKSDEQGSTYMWSLSNDKPQKISLQATVWHKLMIYGALLVIVAILFAVIIMEFRRRNMISWKRAAHMRRMEMLILIVPLLILGYMGYEYYTGTHITAEALAKVSQQKQEELLENREEDKKLQEDEKKNAADLAMSKVRTKTLEFSSQLRDLNRKYQSGGISGSSLRSEAASLASQVQDILDTTNGLSQADRDELTRLINEAESLAASDSVDRSSSSVSEEQRRADAITSDESESRSDTGSGEADKVRGQAATEKGDTSSSDSQSKGTAKKSR